MEFALHDAGNMAILPLGALGVPNKCTKLGRLVSKYSGSKVCPMPRVAAADVLVGRDSEITALLSSQERWPWDAAVRCSVRANRASASPRWCGRRWQKRRGAAARCSGVPATSWAGPCRGCGSSTGCGSANLPRIPAHHDRPALAGRGPADRGTDVQAVLAEQLPTLVAEHCAMRPSILVIDDRSGVGRPGRHHLVGTAGEVGAASAAASRENAPGTPAG
jgi:hypothetical protein